MAPVQCDGLRVNYTSPAVGEMSFGWTEPLCVSGQEVPLYNYPRFDNPYCKANLGDGCYVITCGEDCS